jgi:hypothetical protein
MKWLTAFSCYGADAILVKPPKRTLDINVEDKSHLVYDTKYSSKTKYTSTLTTTTAAAAAVVLMRYVLALGCASTDGTGGLNWL